MKYIVSFFCLSLCTQLFGQITFQKINRDSVKLQVTDSSLDTYYPKLLNRFNQFDTTLTIADYQLLYYGFVFQEGYSAYADVKTKEVKTAITNKEYDNANLMMDKVLKETPVNLRANYHKAVALYLSDSTNSLYSKYAKRYSGLLNAILSTGDGLTCETAFKTISVDDEYEIIYNYFLIQKFYGQALVFPCDKMQVEPNEFFKETYMYFDIAESFIQMQEQFSKPEKSKKKKRN